MKRYWTSDLQKMDHYRNFRKIHSGSINFNLVSKININVQVPNERCMSPEKMTENLHVYLHGIHRSCTPTLTYAVPREIQHQNTPYITVIL